MTPPLVNSGSALHFSSSGFPFISFCFFVRHFTGSPDEFLFQLSLGEYEATKNASSPEDFIFVCKEGEWIGLLENWGMRLQFSKPLRQKMRLLGQSHQAFSAWVGDCDRTFGFHYYDEGNLQRAFDQGDPSWGDETILEDIGTPLEFEGDFEAFEDEWERIPFLARKLGVPLDLSASEIFSYKRRKLCDRLKGRAGRILGSYFEGSSKPPKIE